MDLTLDEALEQYEAECREVTSMMWYNHLKNEDARLNEQGDTGRWMETSLLIGACVVWLAEHRSIRRYTHPDEPLRFLLEEVKEHMK